jgi:hypothetical protein
LGGKKKRKGKANNDLSDLLEIIVTRPGSPNTTAKTKSKSSKPISKKSKNSEKTLEELGMEFKFIITDSNQAQKVEDSHNRNHINLHTSNMGEFDHQVEQSEKYNNETNQNSNNKTTFSAALGSENFSSKEVSAGDISHKQNTRTGKYTIFY